MWGYPTSQPHSPRPVPGWTQVTSNNRGVSSTDCFLWTPMAGLSFQLLSFLQVGLLCSPSYSAWTGLGCLGCYQRLLLWGAPSSHKTGWTGSGAEAIGSGGFNITRDGSEKNRAMRETSQDTCTPLQAALLWVRTAS